MAGVQVKRGMTSSGTTNEITEVLRLTDGY